MYVWGVSVYLCICVIVCVIDAWHFEELSTRPRRMRTSCVFVYIYLSIYVYVYMYVYVCMSLCTHT